MTQSVQDTQIILNTLVKVFKIAAHIEMMKLGCANLSVNPSPRRSQSACHYLCDGVVRGWIIVSKQNARGPHEALSTDTFCLRYVTSPLMTRRSVTSYALTM